MRELSAVAIGHQVLAFEAYHKRRGGLVSSCFLEWAASKDFDPQDVARLRKAVARRRALDSIDAAGRQAEAS